MRSTSTRRPPRWPASPRSRDPARRLRRRRRRRPPTAAHRRPAGAAPATGSTPERDGTHRMTGSTPAADSTRPARRRRPPTASRSRAATSASSTRRTPRRSIRSGDSGNDHMSLYPMYDRLVNFDPETLEATPGLATSWDQPDPQTLVLQLQDGVTFHDGTPFDAEAVKYNLERGLTLETSTEKADLAMIESVEATGPTRGDDPPEPAGRLVAADPRRPPGHDGVAHGGRGLRRRLRAQPGRHRPVQVRRVAHR